MCPLWLLCLCLALPCRRRVTVTGIKGSFAHQDVVPLQSSPRLAKTICQRRRVDSVASHLAVCVFMSYYNDKTAACRTNAVQARTPERVDAQVSSNP